MKKINKNSGFTIVELLIASAIFATVLMVAQAMFIQIGHLFYRGVSISGTQEVADHIFQDINGNFQNAQSVNPGSNSGYSYYCIGNARYTYIIDNKVDVSATPNHTSTGNFGILKDNLPGGGTQCAAPCDDTAGCNYPLTNAVEMLGDKMRVEQFNISPSTYASNLYNVAIVIAYGETDTLTYSDPADKSTVSCQGEIHNNFCAVSRINTALYKGFHQ